jgi:hypothetical protein
MGDGMVEWVGVEITWSVARSDWVALSLNGWSFIAGSAKYFYCVCLFRPPVHIILLLNLNPRAVSVTPAA